jgi:hypothetical protein
MKMRLLRVLLLLLISSRHDCLAEAKLGAFLAANDESSQLRDAAYYGDLDYIRERIRSIKTSGSDELKRQIRPSGLITEAVAGHQYEVLQWCLLEDPNQESLPVCFRSKHMDEKAAKLILKENPKLKPEVADDILFNAVLGENVKLVELLLNSEIKKGLRLNRSLVLAGQNRNFELISLFLKHGADPYSPVMDRYSMVQWAIKLKSASLLKALDQDEKFTAKLQELEKDFPNSPNSPFLGIWVYRKDGFGSFSLNINSDGTGIYGGDIGAMPFVWRPSGNNVKLSMLEAGSGSVDANFLELAIANDKIIVKGKEAEAEEKVELVKFDSLDRSDQAVRRPHYFRIEAVRLINSTNLIIQINGHSASVSIENLILGAQETGYGMEVVEKNLIRWSDFKRGNISDSTLANSVEIPFVDKYADPGYSLKWNQVNFDRDTKALTKSGFDYTLYPSRTTEYYHSNDTGPNGENVQCYVLLSKKPFSHGKDWLMLFLLRSREQ